MLFDIAYIVAISLASALLSEGISWLLIYRTDSYKTLKANIDKMQSQLEKLKEEEASESTLKIKSKAKDRKAEKIEESLKTANRDLSMSNMKSMFAVGVSMIALFSYLNTVFDGKVVCKLPFEPIGFIQNISHRNLPGNDPTDCAMTFLYVLCSMFVRPNLQLILGTKPPAAKSQSNPFAQQ
ncbi:hypothetical protein SAMD00019534_083190 [Acytostelium subglobosum LB1]|uniref:hypothetical protein n=1 Tax=Acytostelium subglobosum LB1 TaxID=1410327 RepID=UPI000644CC73|nr:hypothetical protein SAMD00019534_083190 [Acytostelium subglobosum LB1]GAM25144.1 hypothetical protein SAMD00019534_083190 [Acytostelium subglobosum LB1]|eukprot:XP_012751664.1 hypothetical protein SAMD00019534_083190 [Acytostelium subglobosum LB1]